MSWESSIEIERLVNEEVRRRLGGTHSARLVIFSFDFAEIEALQEAGSWDVAGVQLAEAARGLEAAGADLLVLCTNTMHLVAPAIEAAVAIPLLHVGDVTAAAVRGAGLCRVGLLGTRYTMEQPFLRERLAGHGLEVLVPGAMGRAAVDRVIFAELVRGVVREESRHELRAVAENLVADGCEGVILACTELELLLGLDDVSAPLFPTARLQALAAVDAALS
jgi:aspartate racemase